MRRILLVRHGESEWNSVRRLQGQADIGLSARGELQAKALRQTIDALQPDRVVTSDLARARRTAELLGYGDAPASPALREINVGKWTGEQIADLIAAAPEEYAGWRAGTFTPPEGEVWEAFCDRVSAGLDAALIGSERLLVVCHGGVIRALLDRLVNLPPKCILPVGPASLTVLAEKSGEMRLEILNFSVGGPSFDAPD